MADLPVTLWMVMALMVAFSPKVEPSSSISMSTPASSMPMTVQPNSSKMRANSRILP